jgi:hypothetical protein
MNHHMTCLERAFQLAQSGKYGSIAELKKQLSIEGFSVAQVTGTALSRQLRALIRAAQAAGTT